MSASVVDTPMKKAARFWQAHIGKKAVMAVTGIVLFGFLIGHVLGNLQVFAGAEKINAYSEFLHHSPGILWGTRAILLLSLALHVVAAAQLYTQKHRARPVKYARWHRVRSSLPSRYMLWSGFAILFFVIYHLLHFTFGWQVVHPTFVEGDVYQNMITAFQQPLVSAVYVIAMVTLALHLVHGLWSMLQSIGLAHPTHTPRFKAGALAVGIVLAAAFASIPLGILFGYGRP